MTVICPWQLLVFPIWLQRFITQNDLKIKQLSNKMMEMIAVKPMPTNKSCHHHAEEEECEKQQHIKILPLYCV